MKQQLVLLETPPEWRLDEETRSTGRTGLALAREALRAARRPVEPDDGRPAAA